MARRRAPSKRPVTKRRDGRTTPGGLLPHPLPLRTDRWDVTVPGFPAGDLGAPCGDSGEGEFVHWLHQTDSPTPWGEPRAVLGRGQAGVQPALAEMRQALPFALRGIDSDNGSEFITAHLSRSCQAEAIPCTRGRPDQQDDPAPVEPKHGPHVRQLLGDVRFAPPEACAALHALDRHERRLFQPRFPPSGPRLRQVRVGSRLRRVYARPQTPLARVLAGPEAEPVKGAPLQGTPAAAGSLPSRRDHCPAAHPALGVGPPPEQASAAPEAPGPHRGRAPGRADSVPRLGHPHIHSALGAASPRAGYHRQWRADHVQSNILRWLDRRGR